MLKGNVISSIKKTVFHFLWDIDKINRRPLFAVIAVPLVLTLIVVFVRFQIFATGANVPFMLFLLVVLISACFGGSRSAYYASGITFIAGLILLFIKTQSLSVFLEDDFLQLLFYFIEVLFLSCLLWNFQHKQKISTQEFLGIEQKTEEILERESHLIDFVNMATHELKAPVTVLKAYLQLVELRLSKDNQPEYSRFVVKMDAQVEKLLNLIADLLDSTRISAGSLSCIFNDFEINDCIRECIEGFKASNPDVEIEYELALSNPVVKGDRDRIDQVVTNFISNAIKYSPKGKYIHVKSRVSKDTIVVCVKDNGMGIPPEQQKHVFSRFYRVKSKSTEQLSGLGLGLFICSEIIKKHRGEIGVNSEEAKGSEFWFSLPYQFK